MNTEEYLESILSPKFTSVSWSHLTSITDFCERVSVSPGLVKAGDHIFCQTESRRLHGLVFHGTSVLQNNVGPHLFIHFKQLPI